MNHSSDPRCVCAACDVKRLKLVDPELWRVWQRTLNAGSYLASYEARRRRGIGVMAEIAAGRARLAEFERYLQAMIAERIA